MEIIEEHLISLALLLLQKAKIEKKLRQTFKCFLRKMFSCCGMENIENELSFLNDSINEIKRNKIMLEKPRRITQI
jgi:hypothetical protein